MSKVNRFRCVLQFGILYVDAFFNVIKYLGLRAVQFQANRHRIVFSTFWPILEYIYWLEQFRLLIEGGSGDLYECRFLFFLNITVRICLLNACVNNFGDVVLHYHIWFFSVIELFMYWTSILALSILLWWYIFIHLYNF